MSLLSCSRNISVRGVLKRKIEHRSKLNLLRIITQRFAQEGHSLSSSLSLYVMKEWFGNPLEMKYLVRHGYPRECTRTWPVQYSSWVVNHGLLLNLWCYRLHRYNFSVNISLLWWDGSFPRSHRFCWVNNIKILLVTLYLLPRSYQPQHTLLKR